MPQGGGQVPQRSTLPRIGSPTSEPHESQIFPVHQAPVFDPKALHLLSGEASPLMLFRPLKLWNKCCFSRVFTPTAPWMCFSRPPYTIHLGEHLDNYSPDAAPRGIIIGRTPPYSLEGRRVTVKALLWASALFLRRDPVLVPPLCHLEHLPITQGLHPFLI